MARTVRVKFLSACTYPLTGLGCVSRVYTEYGVFATGPDGVRVLSTYGIAAAELRDRMPVELPGLMSEETGPAAAAEEPERAEGFVQSLERGLAVIRRSMPSIPS